MTKLHTCYIERPNFLSKIYIDFFKKYYNVDKIALFEIYNYFEYVEYHWPISFILNVKKITKQDLFGVRVLTFFL